MFKHYLRILKSKCKGSLIRKRHYASCIGKNSYIDKTVQILGWDNIRIGANSSIGENSILTVNNRDQTAGKRIIINNNSYIGRSNFFSSGKLILLKDYCMTANNCAFIGSNHIFNNPNTPYALTGATSTDTIEVGVNCWIGYGVIVVGNVKIGHGCIIGAGSLINKNIPPFSIVVGNPQKIIKRYNFKKKEWERVTSDRENNQGHDIPDEETYLKLLRENNNTVPIAYHAASKIFDDL